MNKYILLIIKVLLCKYLLAQTTISGEIRPRSEFRNGYRSPAKEKDASAFFVNQRTRLNFGYVQEKLEAYLSVQDVRVWGAEKFNTYNPSIALHESWMKLKLSSGFTIKMGRQAINFDNKRIFSSANWNQTSKKHDAVLLNYKNKGWNIDFVNAFNQTSERLIGTDYSENINNYKYLSTLWVSKKSKQLAVSLMGLVDGFEPATDTLFTRYTYGGIIRFSENDLILTGRGFGQLGRKSINQNVESWLINVEGIYNLGKDKFTAGIEILSGNDFSNTDGKSHTFEMPYGAKHAFNGSMDFFKKSSDTKNLGLTDRYLKWSHKLNDKTLFIVDYHWFSTTKTYLVEDVIYSTYLASEFDFTIKSNLYKSLNLECGYSLLKGSSLLEIFKGGSTGKLNQWAYLMLTFKPVFL